MNFKNIIAEIEKADSAELVSDRREVLKGFGSKVALAALPFAIGSLFNKASAKTTDAVTDALNFLLELKYFEYNYYHIGNNTGGLIPVADKPGFLTIENHKKAHVAFLQQAINELGGVPFVPKHYTDPASMPPYVPNAYDFTKAGTYAVFTDYNSFLVMAQAFEDLGVHAINGQVESFLGTNPLLIQILEMICTEGRHAAHVRLVRRFAGALEGPAPWITNNIPPTIPLQYLYNGEDNVIQSDITITSLPDTYDPSGTVPQISATAAFDETLDKATVKSYIAPFLRP